MTRIISYFSPILVIFFFILLTCVLVLQLTFSGKALVPAVALAADNKTTYSLTQLYNILQRSVVQIDVYDSKLGPLGWGSGFIYDSNGHIVTNQHVAEMPGAGTLSYDAIFSDGGVYSATFIGSDPSSDLAVLHIENASKLNLIPLTLGNSTQVKPGEQIAVFGSAEGLIGTLTEGIVSAVGRSSFSGAASAEKNMLTGMPNLGVEFEQPEFIQTEASVNHGNSGGPAVNMRAEVIGVSDLGIPGAENLNFLVPSDTVKRIVPQLISNGVYRHPWLGVEGVDMTSSIGKILNFKDPKGFLVVNVDENSPASKAGVLGGDRPTSVPREGRSVSIDGDVIISVDGKEIRNKHDLLLYLESKNVGQDVNLTVIRDGSPQQINVVLGQRPGLNELS